MQTLENVELSKVSTFRIGGKARFLINIEQTQELTKASDIARMHGLPVIVIGGGSNVLFPDQGLNAVVIRMMTNRINFDSHTETLTIDAGVRWGTLAKYCNDHKLYGLEPLYGIPGTLGGALYGNAGSFGLEIKDILMGAQIFNLKTQKEEDKNFKPRDFDYRDSVFKKNKAEIITTVKIKVSTDPKNRRGEPQTFVQKRDLAQPKGLTTGSFFKNPYPEYAGNLLEKAGMKGYKLGDVGFSDRHANFVINHNAGTASEVKALTLLAQAKVKEMFGIDLEPEVQEITIANSGVVIN
jgi:UDP-N-acetylmuramate dehydrogenase